MLTQLFDFMSDDIFEGISRSNSVGWSPEVGKHDLRRRSLHLDLDAEPINVDLGFIIDTQATRKGFSKLDRAKRGWQCKELGCMGKVSQSFGITR
jgi:hypothetical protein